MMLVVFFYGVIASLMIYNFFLGFSLTEPIYFTYVAMLLCWQVAMTAYYNGLSSIIFGSYGFLAVQIPTTILPVIALKFMLDFINDGPQKPWLSRIAKGCAIFTSVFAFLTFLAVLDILPANWTITLQAIQTLGMLSLVISAFSTLSILGFFLGNSQASLLFLCWAPLLASSVYVLIGYISGDLDSFWTRNIMALAGIIEGLLLAAALAAKYKKIREQLLITERNSSRRLAAIIKFSRDTSLNLGQEHAIEQALNKITTEIPRLIYHTPHFIIPNNDQNTDKWSFDEVSQINMIDLCFPVKRHDKEFLYLVTSSLRIEELAKEEVLFIENILLSLAATLDSLNFLASETKRAEGEAEMRAARSIQTQLLATADAIPDLDIAYHYAPADQTGGDWFGTFHDERRKLCFLCCGDVTGHGLPAALMSGVAAGSIEALLQSAFRDPEPYEPTELLLKTLIHTNKVLQRQEVGDTPMMTLSIAVINLENGQVWFANAGHHPPYHVSSGKIVARCVPGSILGYPQKCKFGLGSFQILPGDSIIQYTDGLIENEGKEGQKVTRRLLRRTLLSCAEEPSSQICKRMIAEGSKLWKTQPQQDDCTVVVYKWLKNFERKRYSS